MEKRLITILFLLFITALGVSANNISSDIIAASGYGGSGGGYKSSGKGYGSSSAGYNSSQKNSESLSSESDSTSNSTVQNGNKQSSLSDSDGAEKLKEWLSAHPDKAAELQQILPNASNPTAELQKWLDANPDCAKELEQLLLVK